MAGGLVVFLGPTLPRAEAAAILDATYLPPAEQGSVVRAVRTYRPLAIVLIDGSFGKVPAVRHKEILWALAERHAGFRGGEHGRAPGGRAGAIRDAGPRLHLSLVRATLLADDDEVAVAMSPAGARRRAAQRSADQHAPDAAPRRACAESCGRSSGARWKRWRATRISSTAAIRACSPMRAVTLPGRSRAATSRPPGGLAPVGAHRPQARGRDRAACRLAAARNSLDAGPDTPPFRLTEAWAYDLDAAGLWDDDIASILAETSKVT